MQLAQCLIKSSASVKSAYQRLESQIPQQLSEIGLWSQYASYPRLQATWEYHRKETGDALAEFLTRRQEIDKEGYTKEIIELNVDGRLPGIKCFSSDFKEVMAYLLKK